MYDQVGEYRIHQSVLRGCTVESSFQLSSSVYLRRCRTALVGYMLDQSNFLMCVT